MKRLFFLVIILVLSSLGVRAQGIEAVAPRVVAQGEQFRIEFVVDGKSSNFVAPSFKGLEILAGPSTSQSMQSSMVNGNFTQKVTHIYSYAAYAPNKGNITIGAASVKIDGKEYKSKPITIEVADEVADSAAANQSSQGAKTTLAKDDLILLLEVSNSNPYKGEAINVIVKLLSRVDVAGLEGLKSPSLSGFWQQDLSRNQRAAWARETYNDKVYQSAIIDEWLLYPQQDGKIEIEPVTLNVVARISDPSSRSANSMFDSFFGGGGGYRDIRKILSTEAVTINVKPYPMPIPASFNGAVGNFAMKSVLSNNDIVANSAANLVVTLTGSGNLQLITEPNVTLPSSFELYKVTTKENLSTTHEGVSGTKEFTYPFIARAKGNYTIEPFEFTYFNPKSKKFVTLSSDKFPMKIEADNSSSAVSGAQSIVTTNQESLQIIGSDIRHIESDSGKLVSLKSLLLGSTLYYAIMVLLAVMAIAAVAIMRKIAEESQDVVRVKSKRANKVALNNLKEANRALTSGNKELFHDAVLRAMWGYVADKLNIDKASLSRDNVASRLLERGAGQAQIDTLLSIISTCEEARYAPSASSAMNDTYNSALEFITSIENKL